MISLKITNIKNFTSHLLVKDTFADMLLVEAQINTHSTFTINGQSNTAYYSAEESRELAPYTSWKQLRPICYEIIKGRSLPTSFKFIMKMNETQVMELLANAPEYNIQDIGGVFLNIRYDNDSLTIVTGTSMNVFTLDKSIDKAFDTYVTQFMDNNSIEYEIC